MGASAKPAVGSVPLIHRTNLPGVASRRNAPTRIIHGTSLSDMSVTSSRRFEENATGG